MPGQAHFATAHPRISLLPHLTRRMNVIYTQLMLQDLTAVWNVSLDGS
jgi:hypothetical protein